MSDVRTSSKKGHCPIVKQSGVAISGGISRGVAISGNPGRKPWAQHINALQ